MQPYFFQEKVCFYRIGHKMATNTQINEIPKYLTSKLRKFNQKSTFLRMFLLHCV